MKESYEMGKAAHQKSLPRKPLNDHVFAAHIQTKSSAKYHPNSPGAELSDSGRRVLEKKITEWKRGWDDAHKEELEK